MINFFKYFLSGTAFWFVVDFTTTEAIRNPSKYYSMFMPTLLIFYVGFPLIFSLLIYKFKVNNKLLLIATLVEIFVVEIVFAHNVLLYTFPFMLFAIPVAISIYSFITFVPKWIVDRTIQNNKWKLLIMTIVWIFVSLATLFGKT